MAPRTMNPEDYVVADDGPVSYASQARRASGNARQATGMAPYPLYGIGQVPATTDAGVPFYRTMWFGGVLGAASVGALWAYLGWWRPRQSRMKKKSEKNKGRKRFMKAGNED